MFEGIKWLKRNAFHIIFIMSLTMLTLLVTWWAVFINRSINESYQMKFQGVMQQVQLHAFSLGNNKNYTPMPGPYNPDPRLEIVPTNEQAKSNCWILTPLWPEFALRPTDTFLEQIQQKRERQRLMIVGESSLLVLLILVSGLMIYRMYWLEKRTTAELHEFWSRMTHEIKTPITGLKAFLETLRDQDLKREELTPLITLAFAQVDRQQKLSENILMGQKLKRKRLEIQSMPIDVVNYCHQFFRQSIIIGLIEKTVEISPSTEEEENKTMEKLMVKADGEALRIIFDNLTDNAIKYAGPSLHLQVEIKRKGKYVQIIFRDNGPGFTPEVSKNIFGAYKRLRNELPGSPQGTGLGLYISRQLAEKMGGTLYAGSRANGTGAEFILSLPTADN